MLTARQVTSPVVRGITALFLGTVLTASASEPEFRNPREYFFTQSFGDLPEELATARQDGKLGLLLFFESEGCSYCRRMLREVLSRKEVQDWYRSRFLSIAVDIHGDVELTDLDGITLPSKVFSDHREVFITPLIAFLDLDGREIYRHIGMVKTPGEFLLIGEYVAGGHYFDTEFRVFRQRHGWEEEEGVLVTPAAESDSSRKNQ